MNKKFGLFLGLALLMLPFQNCAQKGFQENRLSSNSPDTNPLMLKSWTPTEDDFKKVPDLFLAQMKLASSVTPICPVTIMFPTGTRTVLLSTTAMFESLKDDLNGLSIEANQPIPWAEIRVTDSTGKFVQCSRTTITGAVKVIVPIPLAGVLNYKIEVLSRSNNPNYLNASVLTRPDNLVWPRKNGHAIMRLMFV